MLPKSLDTLIAKTRDSVTPLGHSPSTLWQYEYGWRHFRAYAMGRGEVAFSTVLAAEYLQELRLQYEDGSLKEWRFKLARKTVSLLTQQWETGEVWWTHLPAWGRDDPPPHHDAILGPYASHLAAAGYGRGTRDVYQLVAKHFLRYIDREQVPFAAVTLADVSGFIPVVGMAYQPTSMRTVLSALRHFLRWAAETGAVANDLTAAVPRSSGRKTVVVPTLTAAEEQRLLRVFDRKTAIGRRDYAICLLALRLGLRAGDILRLRWSDFDWRSQTLSVVQQKTGRRLTTPLLADVGNSVIDYGLHGRPSTDPRGEAPSGMKTGRPSRRFPCALWRSVCLGA